MDIEYCKNFIIICENKFNLTKASSVIHISQPALSKMIRIIEQELNTRLFIRHKGKFVKLTKEGHIFLSYCQNIISLYSQLTKEIKSSKKASIPNVTMGISSYILDVLLSEHYTELFNHDKYDFEIIESFGADLLLKFLQDEFDIVLMVNNELTTNALFQTKHLLTYPYVAVVNKNHTLAQEKFVTWQDLNHQNIAIPWKGNQVYEYITNQLNINLCFPEKIISTSSSNALLKLSAHKGYISIIPEIFYLKYKKDLNLISLPFKQQLLWELNIYLKKEKIVSNPILLEVCNKIEKVANRIMEEFHTEKQ